MLASGQLLGSYRLVGKLGQGGMGVVWKAVDTRLDRDVAIKLLPEQFADDPERMGRFEREARLLASLNHRNIASIYGLDEANGVRFLVMELVEGEDLAQRLEGGPLPVEEALDICHQLARAIENAHEKGILHRDLKPANVRLTHDGNVKVLDFGLAKAFDTGPQIEGDPGLSPTLTSVETRAGIILGTAAYMSPEQARGKPLDKRTDIWAFGCLLYECLTGQSAFRGETVTDTLAGIVKSPADWSALPADTPPRVRELLSRCLEKDVRNRLRDIGEARIELQRSIGASDSVSGSSPALAVPTTPVARTTSPVRLLLAGVVGVAIGIGIWAMLSGSPAPAPGGSDRPVRFSIAFPPDLLEGGGWDLSPDGQTVAYVGRPRGGTASDDDNITRLYLRPLDALEAIAVPGSEGVRAFSFSPDGRWLVMLAPVAPRSTKSRLLKVPVDGGSPPLALLDWRDDWNFPALWLPDGDIVVLTGVGSGFVRFPSGGGSPGDPVTIKPEGYEGFFRLSGNVLSVLPDGAHALGTVTTYTERGYENSVGLLDLDTGVSRILIENGASPVLSPTGHLVFSRGDALLASAFDAGRQAPSGDTVAVQAGFRALAGYGDTDFSLSTDGTLLHWPGGIYGDKRKLVFVEHDAGSFRIGEPWSDDMRFFDGALVVSVDDRRLAATITNDGGLYEIWISDLDRPRLRRFVHESGRDCTPETWTPDGEALLYTCRTTSSSVAAIRSVESGETRELIASTPPEFYFSAATLSDGSAVVFTHFAGGKSHLDLLPLDAEAGKPAPHRAWLDDAVAPQISPDGRWLAYASDVSGRNEIYLRPLRADGTLGSEIPVSSKGGGTGGWVAGKPMRLSYHVQDEFYVVEVGADGRLSTPRSIGNTGQVSQATKDHTHLSDGRWLAILKDEGEETPDRLNVVLHWTTELAARMGAK